MTDSIRRLFPNRIQDGQATIEVIDGPQQGLVVRIDPDEQILVGSDAACQLRLEDDQVCGRHARIRSNGTEVLVFDIPGSSGVYSGQERVEYRILCPGDELRIGRAILRVTGSASPPSIDPRNAMRMARRAIRAGLVAPEAMQAALRAWEQSLAEGQTTPFTDWLVAREIVSIEDAQRLAEQPSPSTAVTKRRTRGRIIKTPREVPIARSFLDPEILEVLATIRPGTAGSDEPILLGDLLGITRDLSRQHANRILDLEFELQGIGQVPGFRYCQLIGAGSAGFVFEAESEKDGQTVALKIIRPDLLARESAVKRFLRESRILLSLSHENLVRGYEVGNAGNLYFMSMEYVVGESLAVRIKRTGPLTEPESASILRQIAGGLVHAHEKKVLHRDIKPANILLLEDGSAKLCDMGLAKMCGSVMSTTLTASGFVVGTPDYMSPEQAQGSEDIDSRTDIYSLGASLYHALVGKPPFHHPSPVEVMLMQIQEPLVPPIQQRPDLSKFMSQLIEKMMSKNPASRPQEPQQLIDLVDARYPGI